MPGRVLQGGLQRIFRVLTTLKAKDKSFNEDEKTVRSQNHFVEIRFLGPPCVEMPKQGHQVELASGEGSQISTGILICSQIIWQIRRLAESIKETVDIDFGSAGDDDLQP